MKSALLLASIGMLAAAVSTSSLGGERDHRHDRAHAESGRTGSGGMQTVPTSVAAGEPGYGWRYFTDPAAHRAVVISPQGEYYYSRGKGLVLVAVTQPVS
ncbi:MAG TPA: hypothetical protein VFZ28_03400 [Burkholderiaceae bacterium]|nr:hypothetical protein [Burkholderiaceae bacterium]